MLRSGTVCPKKRLPLKFKRLCRMFEIECFNSLMAKECIERYSREFLCTYRWSRIPKETKEYTGLVHYLLQYKQFE